MREYGIEFTIAIRSRLSNIARKDIRLTAGNVYSVHGAMFLRTRTDTGQLRMQRTGMVAGGYALFDTITKATALQRRRMVGKAQRDRRNMLQIPQECVSFAVLRESRLLSTRIPAINQQL